MPGSNFVIDASVVIAYVLDDESSATANAVVASLCQYDAVAPSFLSLEISNILLLAERRCRVKAEQRRLFVKKIEELQIAEDVYSQERIFSRVLPMAAYHGLTTYDACYLELAARCSMPLATLDKKLRSAAQAQGVTLFDGE